MLLQLRAKHFKGTSFIYNNCALEKAAKERFKTDNIMELVDEIEISGELYKHRDYHSGEFVKDKAKAKKLHYSNEILKNIKLTKCPQ